MLSLGICIIHCLNDTGFTETSVESGLCPLIEVWNSLAHECEPTEKDFEEMTRPDQTRLEFSEKNLTGMLKTGI